jgi:pyruvate dehydrogenase E1 component beta subunit
METILNSIEKTGRCVIVHEAARTCGIGAEIAAQVADKGLMSLLAPVKRVTGYDVVVPYLQLEKYQLPNVKKILTAVHTIMEYV